MNTIRDPEMVTVLPSNPCWASSGGTMDTVLFHAVVGTLDDQLSVVIRLNTRRELNVHRATVYVRPTKSGHAASRIPPVPFGIPG